MGPENGTTGADSKMSAATTLQPTRRHPLLNGTEWSDEERDVLNQFYPDEGAPGCQRRLPRHRSILSIRCAARRFGLKTRPRWTPDEERIVRSDWGSMTLPGLARKLGRTSKAIHKRAGRIGVQLGAPQGTEYLINAAKRAGFDVKTFRYVLAYSGIRPRLVPVGAHRRHRVAFRQSYVDPQDVDDAVAKWMSSEEINPAAKARGIGWCTLVRWLREAGIRRPSMMRKRHWRLPSEVIDRMLAERAARCATKETIQQAANRHGVGRETMRAWLNASGVAHVGRPCALDPFDVDRAVAANDLRGRCASRMRYALEEDDQ